MATASVVALDGHARLSHRGRPCALPIERDVGRFLGRRQGYRFAHTVRSLGEYADKQREGHEHAHRDRSQDDPRFPVASRPGRLLLGAAATTIAGATGCASVGYGTPVARFIVALLPLYAGRRTRTEARPISGGRRRHRGCFSFFATLFGSPPPSRFAGFLVPVVAFLSFARLTGGGMGDRGLSFFFCLSRDDVSDRRIDVSCHGRTPCRKRGAGGGGVSGEATDIGEASRVLSRWEERRAPYRARRVFPLRCRDIYERVKKGKRNARARRCTTEWHSCRRRVVAAAARTWRCP